MSSHPVTVSAWRRVTACILLLCFVFLHATVLPAQAFLGLGGFGIKDEKELGRKFEVLVRSQLPLVEDPEVSQYVKHLVERLSLSLPPQPFPFTSGVVLHNALNAFAVPGGHVFIFTGLIMNLDNEAELAGVLAHEMAHVTQRHVASRIERGKYLTIAALLVAVAGIAAGGSGGGVLAAGALGASQSAMLNYSRIDETEADHMGFQYLVKANYPPSGMVGGFQKIRQKSSMSGTSIPTYLSTHPDVGTRISDIMARVQVAPPAVQKRTFDNTRFERVKALLWARYGHIPTAKQIFAKNYSSPCLSRMGEAMLLARENNIHAANTAFDNALACNARDPLILREAGTFHYRKGDTAQAEQLLSTAIKIDPRDYMARFFYARLLDETKRSPEALRYYQDVLRELPQDQEVHAVYARSLGHTGRHFDAYLHMAYSALYNNDKKRTKQYFEQAKGKAVGASQQADVARFDTRYKERKEIWDQGM